MPDAATDGPGRKSSMRTITLPDVPPEDSLLHVVLEYRKQLDLALAGYLLLDVVKGHAAPHAACFVSRTTPLSSRRNTG